MPTNKTPDSRKKNTNLSVDLVEMVRNDILSEKLYPGSKITEKAISEKYGVSRTPVRESLKHLESEGLIELIPNRGAFVVGFSLGDMKDLVELRKTYELLCIRWAIERIYDDELEHLEKCFEYMKFYTKQNEVENLTDINSDFHNIIYQATHNRMLINILSLYNYYIRNSNLTDSIEEEDLFAILEEHTKIFNAFIMQNVDEGIIAMTEHLDNASKRYL